MRWLCHRFVTQVHPPPGGLSHSPDSSSYLPDTLGRHLQIGKGLSYARLLFIGADTVSSKMKGKALLITAFMGYCSSLSAEIVPEATIFNDQEMKDFMQLKSEVLQKDEFETTAEFEERKAAHASRQRS